MLQRSEVVCLLVADARVKCVDPYMTLVASCGGKFLQDAGFNLPYITNESRRATINAVLTLDPPVNPTSFVSTNNCALHYPNISLRVIIVLCLKPVLLVWRMLWNVFCLLALTLNW